MSLSRRRYSCARQLLLASLLLVATPRAGEAKGCSEGTPAYAVPASLWGELRPAGILNDSTTWTGSEGRLGLGHKVSTTVDVENGYLFHSFYYGFAIWNANGDPAHPTMESQKGWYEEHFPIYLRSGEFTQVIFAIDAPAGDDGIVAIGGMPSHGLSIWNTANKRNPIGLYQDYGVKMIHQVYAARIGGRDYAFAATFDGDIGLHLYDMTAARQYSRCVENRSEAPARCPGVYLERVGGQEGAKYVSGLAVGSRHFVAKSNGGASLPKGLEIWDVTSPTDARRVVGGLVDLTQKNSTIFGHAMWTEAGRHYLAVRDADRGKIFDVTGCLTTGCSALPAPLWVSPALQPNTGGSSDGTEWLSVTFSRSDATPFLYFGNSDPCRQGQAPGRTEYLLEVSDPTAPREVMNAAATIADQGETVDYWSWYYPSTLRGFSNVMPRGGKFHGKHFYRAAGTLFDAHLWTGTASAAPEADFTWAPAEIYAGEPVTFSDTSRGTVTSRTWTFADGTAAGSATAPSSAPAEPPAPPSQDPPR